PTTGLDASAEALVLDGMGRLMRGRTVLVIAHRLSTISRADLILVVEHGRIVERGTHDSLLAAGGRYRELFELQSRGQVAVPVGGARLRSTRRLRPYRRLTPAQRRWRCVWAHDRSRGDRDTSG